MVVLYFVSINCVKVLVHKHSYPLVAWIFKVNKDQKELNPDGTANVEKPESTAL